MELLYLIIPVIFYSLGSTILTKFSRECGSLSISFYRQLAIFIVGLPLLYFFPLDIALLSKNIFPIITTSLLGGLYIFIVFKSYDFIPVAVGTAFSLTSRILMSIGLGIMLFGEKVNIHQGIGIVILLISILSLLKVKERLSNTTIIAIICITLSIIMIKFFEQS